MSRVKDFKTWSPRLGATMEANGVCFRIWAPTARRVDLVWEAADLREEPMAVEGNGFFVLHVPGMGAGTHYRFRVDGQGPFPDPASRYQPLGVHSVSEVVDPHRYAWSDQAWQGVAAKDVVIYELHVGTFTALGTFAGVREYLRHLHDLGITAVELMPVADFPGQRNWGYDGVSLFAPARCYGRPDDLRSLVDAAHALGMAVILDVVYNHLGPDGNYLGAFSPFYFTDRHHTPWGKAVNLDGENCGPVRAFFIENALHWLHEYHFDGLRLDATHALLDDGPGHFLGELAANVHALPGRRRLVIAEDERNLSQLVRTEAEGGLGLDAVWADDFHHHVRRRLAGDHDGYFADFSGQVKDIADTLEHGFFYRGQVVPRLGKPRGNDSTGIPAEKFVFCVQNHDQVGNRALGERLHHQLDPAAYRAALALYLLSPQTPLIFMGQEWATSSPFLYFTDHHPELGKLVTEGRREEFKVFEAFSSPDLRTAIPDPQDATTFLRSRLRWMEREGISHARVLALHTALLRLRKAVHGQSWERLQVQALDERNLVLRYPDWLVVVCLEGSGNVALSEEIVGHDWHVALDTEHSDFAADPCPAVVERSERKIMVQLHRPSALVMNRQTAGDRS